MPLVSKVVFLHLSSICFFYTSFECFQQEALHNAPASISVTTYGRRGKKQKNKTKTNTIPGRKRRCHNKYGNPKFGSNWGKYRALPFYHDKYPTSLNLNGAKPNSQTAVQNLPAINIPVWCPSFPFSSTRQHLNVLQDGAELDTKEKMQAYITHA